MLNLPARLTAAKRHAYFASFSSSAPCPAPPLMSRRTRPIQAAAPMVMALSATLNTGKLNQS